MRELYVGPVLSTRRDFLRQFAGTAALAAGWPAIAAAGQAAAIARDGGADFAHLDAALARDLAAVAERILPSDDLPGANDAGVIYFIDEALGSFANGQHGLLGEGIEGLNAAIPSPSGASLRFADLPADEQDRILRGIDTTPLFGQLRFLTLAGMFAMPAYGGNRDHQGWALLGFPHQHVWAPPFGFYDSQAAADESLADDDQTIAGQPAASRGNQQ